MKQLYNKLTKKAFKRFAILFFFLGDLLSFSFIYYSFNNFILFKKIVENNLEKNGLSIRDLPHFQLDEIFQLINQTLILTIALFMVFHLIVYFFYYKDKFTAFFYLKILSFVAIFGCLMIGVTEFTSFTIFGPLFLIQAGLYSFIALGFLKFKIEVNRDLKKAESEE